MVALWAKNNFEEMQPLFTLTSGLIFDNDAYTQGIISGGN